MSEFLKFNSPPFEKPKVHVEKVTSELSEEDWKEIEKIPWPEWMESVFQHFQKNNNNPITMGEMPGVAGNRDPYSVASRINSFFILHKAPYRFSMKGHRWQIIRVKPRTIDSDDQREDTDHKPKEKKTKKITTELANLDWQAISALPWTDWKISVIETLHATNNQPLSHAQLKEWSQSQSLTFTSAELMNIVFRKHKAPYIISETKHGLYAIWKVERY